MGFSTSKSPLNSITIRGIIVMLVPTLLALFGYDLGDDGAGLIANVVDHSIELVGAATAIYGRFKAIQTLRL